MSTLSGLLPAPARRPVLIVDDDVELCGLLEGVLSRHGFAASFAHDGASGLGRSLSGAFDLVLLDVTLPRIDGFEVLCQLRRRTDVPVIMLSARAGARDRIDGLDGGADDYVVKPFAVAELLARMRAVGRRALDRGHRPPKWTHVGPIRISIERGEAWSGTRLLDLTATEFALLDLLVRRAGCVVSRDEIIAVLHQREAAAYERALDVHISHLRRKIETDAASRIRTVRGVGYTFSIGE